MQTDLDELDVLIEGAVNFADISAGHNGFARLNLQSRLPISLSASVSAAAIGKSPRWTSQEDDYLRQNLGWLTEAQMAEALGRTVVAVRLRWKRDLRLISPSKNPDYLSGQAAARLLGLDEHQITHWCDSGMIRHRLMAGQRKIRLIYRTALDMFVVNPENWIYFDWHKLPDARLRRLCELRAARWGDEWWTTRQVAEYHGVNTSDVKRLIQRGEIPGVQTQVSRCGRYTGRSWANWYVRRTDAIQARFWRGRGSVPCWEPSPRAKAFLLRAMDSGWTYTRIARLLHGPCKQTVVKVISELLTEKS